VPVPWWERHPGRLEHELGELDRLGMAYTSDATARAAGLLRLTVTVPLREAGAVEVVATFPDLYPYFRPEVKAPALDLAHHQHPFAKNLCLLGRSTANWTTADTLAGILHSQLGTTIRDGAADPPPGPARDALDEEHQGEPYSDYYSYAAGVMLLVDGGWSIDPADLYGDLVLRVNGSLPPPTNPPQQMLLDATFRGGVDDEVQAGEKLVQRVGVAGIGRFGADESERHGGVGNVDIGIAV
jgi:hypothetical protein